MQDKSETQSGATWVWCRDSRVDVSCDAENNPFCCYLNLTFLPQDPDSEAGSTETEVSEVRDSYRLLLKSSGLFALMAYFLFFCNSCVEVTWEKIQRGDTLRAWTTDPAGHTLNRHGTEQVISTCPVILQQQRLPSLKLHLRRLWLLYCCVILWV